MDPALKTAWDKAATSGKPVEVPSRFTETMKVWATPNGKNLRAELYTRPVQLKNSASGAWEPIDTRIVTRDGKLQATRVKSPLTLGGRGSNHLVSADGEQSTTGLKTTRALPEPKISGSTVTYPDAVAPGADLVVQAQADGFISQVVFRKRPTGPVTVRLPLTLPKGTTFGTTPDGLPQLKDAKGKAAAAPIVLTAMDAKVESSPEEGKSSPVDARVQTSGTASELVFTPDEKFLADTAVTYPVTIAAASEWFGGGEPDDAWVSKNSPSTNNAAAGWLRVGTTSTSADIARVYLKFDTDDPALEGATVVDADLWVWNYKSGGPGSQLCGNNLGSIAAAQVTSAWTLNGATNNLSWSRQPSFSGSLQGVNTAGYNYEADPASWCAKEEQLVHRVTGMARGWIEQGVANHGMVLRAVSESATINWRQYYSSEHSGDPYPGYRHPPTLMVEYVPAETKIVAYEYRHDGIPDDAEDDLHPEDPRIEPGTTVFTPEQAKAITEQSGRSAEVPSNAIEQGPPEGLTQAEIDEVAQPEEWEQPPVTTPSPAAHWKFDEGSGRVAADASGHGHGATLESGTSWVPGKIGNAISGATSEPSQGSASDEASSVSPARFAATVEAAKQGTPVEVADETTATSVTYAQPDGKTFKTEIAAGPVRTEQNGTWVPIDTTLAERDGVLKAKAIDAKADVEISTGGTGAFVRMATDGRRYALIWPTALPRPTVKDSVATYTDAAGKGADLVVTVLPTGFRHDVVLRERPAKPLEIRIGVQTEGLTLSKGEGGRLLLTDIKAGMTGTDKRKGDKLVASAPQPVMWDASAGARPAQGRLPRARHAKIATDVVATDGRTELVLKPDHAFLSDPATKYPVRVDPTTTLPFNHDVEVSSINDADGPADPTSAFMVAGTQAGNLKYRVHLRFDTAGLTGAPVSDAKLSLLNIGAQACGSTAGAGIQVRRLTSAWDENNLHWANKPTATTEDAQTNRAAYDSACADPTALEWPVTAIAQDWAGGAANHGLVLQSPTETNVNNYRVFPSSEDTFEFNSPPTLTVTTTGPASAPAIGALTVTPAQNSGGVTTVTSLTPQLAGTVSDTIGGTLTGQFEIEHDPTATGQGTGQIWTGTSPAVASGSTTTITVPAAKLTDGWKVRWRARAISTTTTSAWSAWQEVTVDVLDPDSNPTVTAPHVNPSQEIDGKIFTTSLTPQLTATVTDSIGGNLTGEFEIEHDTASPDQGIGQIWAGASSATASGSQAVVNVPAGNLTNGWKIRWRARAVSATTASAWSPWQETTIDLDQSGEGPLAQTAGPVVRTDQSFTITAWVRWNDKDGNYTLIDQKGTNVSPFSLGNSPDHGLVFTATNADSPNSSTEGVLSGIESPANEWFHVAAAYDSVARTLALYVNGTLAQEKVISFAPWNSAGPLSLGSSLVGQLDEVQLYQEALWPDYIATIAGEVGQTATARDRPGKAETNMTKSAAPPSNKSFPARYDWTLCEDYWEDNPEKRYHVMPASGFSHCGEARYISKEKKKVRGLWKTVGYQSYAVGIVVNTYQNTRDMDVEIRIYDFLNWGTTANNPIAVQIKPGGSPTPDHCKLDPTSQTKNLYHSKSAAEWPSTLLRYKFNSPSTGTTGPNFFSTCTTDIVGIFITRAGNGHVSLHDPTKPHGGEISFLSMRCDSTSYIKWYKSGGCIIPRLIRRLFLSSKDTDPKTGKPWPEQVAHIKKALTKPNTTYPKLGGPSFPESAGGSKDIPGTWGDPAENKFLHRLVNTDKRRENYENSVKTCRKEIKSSWVTDVKKFPDTAENCDEFPMASTYEGSKLAKPAWNYSVDLINGAQNQAWGRQLKYWYENNRVLDNDPFGIVILD